jgi:hypothetical protein
MVVDVKKPANARHMFGLLPIRRAGRSSSGWPAAGCAMTYEPYQKPHSEERKG